MDKFVFRVCLVFLNVLICNGFVEDNVMDIDIIFNGGFKWKVCSFVGQMVSYKDELDSDNGVLLVGYFGYYVYNFFSLLFFRLSVKSLNISKKILIVMMS